MMKGYFAFSLGMVNVIHMYENRKPLVSVVVTTCKRKPEIVKRAIKSILDQSYDNLEIIVVDDSPADYQEQKCVEEAVYELCESVLYIKNEASIGACASRNKGLSAAKGDYIAYLDDDDVWLPKKIEKQVYVMQQASPETAMIYGNYYRYDPKKNEKIEVCNTGQRGNIYNTLLELGNFCGGTSIPLIKTVCLREVGGFDKDMPAIQDYDVWLRLSKLYNIDYVDDFLILYYWEDSNQISKNPDKKIVATERILAKYHSDLVKNRRAKNRLYNNLAVHYMEKKEAPNTIKNIIKACVIYPNACIRNAKIAAYVLKGLYFR